MFSTAQQITFNQRRETYFQEKRYAKPKAVFQLLAKLLRERGEAPFHFVDFGCATGELIYFLRSEFPRSSFEGIDNVPEFIESAAREVEGCAFEVADILNWRGKKADAIACFGVVGVFNDFEPLFENIIANLNDGGSFYVQGLFNPDDIDVRMSYRDNANKVDWNVGFNIFSRPRVAAWAQERGFDVSWHDVVLPEKVAKRENTPHRAFTVEMGDGTRRQTNGLCLLLPDTVAAFTPMRK